MRPVFCYLSFFLASVFVLGGMIATVLAILLLTQLSWWSLALFAAGVVGIYLGAVGCYEAKCHLRGHVPW